MRLQNRRFATAVLFFVIVVGAFMLLRSGGRALSAGTPQTAGALPARSGARTADAALVTSGDSFGLMQAINVANARPAESAPYRIYLADGTYTFHTAGEITRAWLPAIQGKVILYGQNSEIVLSGSGSTTPAQLVVQEGASLELHNVTFRGERNNGRAIVNHGSLAVYDSQFFDGEPSGAQLDSNPGLSGIHNNGELTVARSLFARNQSLSTIEPGGALRNVGKASLTCTRFEDNRAERGGAIFNDYGAQLFVAQSAFTGNQANGGGAIFASSAVEANGNWWGGNAPRIEAQNFSADTLSVQVAAAEVAESDPTLSAACAMRSPTLPPAELLALQSAAGLFIMPSNPPALPPSVNSRKEVSRARFTEVDFNAAFAVAAQGATGSSFILDLFGDTTWLAVNDRIEQHAASTTGYTWIGRLLNKPASEVVLSFDQGTMHGYISSVDQLFAVEYSGSGSLHYILELDASQFDPCGGALVPPATTQPPAQPAPAVELDGALFPVASDLYGNPIIDVIVVYTADARSAAGGTQAMLNEVNSAIAITNQSYANTGITQRVRLVYTAEVTYTETGNMYTDLDRITGTTDGFMDQVHTWRNLYKADMVAMLTQNGGGFCGLAWLMTSVTTGFAPNAFSVTARGCITNFSFGHELGHNMGSQHNPEDGSGGAYSYSYGYRDNVDPVRFRTVMAYACSGASCPRVNYWSNTIFNYLGDPMGNANQNNRLSLGNTAATVAAFRTNGLVDTIGLYRPSTSQMFLRNSLSTGPADLIHLFGGPNDYPIAGDWNGDGVDTIGVYRRTTGEFFLKDSNASGAPVVYSFVLGSPNDIPMVGDWDGDGRDGVGVFRPSNGLIYIRSTLTTGIADYTLVLGNPGDLPVAGDWNGNGRDGIGVFRPSTGTFYLLNNAQQNGIFFADLSLAFGANGDTPIAGDWDGDGIDGIGVFRGSASSIFLRNTLSTGPAQISFNFGATGDLPLSGRYIQP